MLYKLRIYGISQCISYLGFVIIEIQEKKGKNYIDGQLDGQLGGQKSVKKEG